MIKKYRVRTKVVVWPGEQGVWHFAYVDKKNSALIKERYKGPRRGFGGVRVAVVLGKTKWETSIFPDKRSSCYILPLKASVRRAEGVFEGDDISFALTII